MWRPRKTARPCRRCHGIWQENVIEEILQHSVEGANLRRTLKSNQISSVSFDIFGLSSGKRQKKLRSHHCNLLRVQFFPVGKNVRIQGQKWSFFGKNHSFSFCRQKAETRRPKTFFENLKKISKNFFENSKTFFENSKRKEFFFFWNFIRNWKKLKKYYSVIRKWWSKWMEKIKEETKKLRLNTIQRFRFTHRGIEMSRHFFSTVYSRTAMSCSIFFAAKFCKKNVKFSL